MECYAQYIVKVKEKESKNQHVKSQNPIYTKIKFLLRICSKLKDIIPTFMYINP